MIPAVIFHHEDGSFYSDEYRLLMPSLMLAPRVILATDNAHLFWLKKHAGSSSPLISAEAEEIWAQICRTPAAGAYTNLSGRRDTKSPDNNDERNCKNSGETKTGLLEMANAALADLKLSSIAELNCKSKPDFIEVCMTNAAYTQMRSDKNLTEIFRRVLFNHAVIPVLPQTVYLLGSRIKDKSADYCPDERILEFENPFLNIPTLSNFSVNAFKNFRQKLLPKTTELNSLIGRASMQLRGRGFDESIAEDFDRLFRRIYSTGNELFEETFKTYNKMISPVRYPEEVHSFALRVASARKLIRDYCELGMINLTVRSSIENMFKCIDPRSCIVSLVVRCFELSAGEKEYRFN